MLRRMRHSVFVGELAREPHRYSGRTAMRANVSVHEPRQPPDIDAMFTFSMEGDDQPSCAPFASAICLGAGLELPPASNEYQDEVGGELRFGDRACVC
ncbi:hypothetical protein ACNKHX_14270 [Shigella flexneri]